MNVPEEAEELAMQDRTINNHHYSCVCCDDRLKIGQDIYMEKEFGDWVMCRRCYEEYSFLKRRQSDKG